MKNSSKTKQKPNKWQIPVKSAHKYIIALILLFTFGKLSLNAQQDTTKNEKEKQSDLRFNMNTEAIRLSFIYNWDK